MIVVVVTTMTTEELTVSYAPVSTHCYCYCYCFMTHHYQHCPRTQQLLVLLLPRTLLTLSHYHLYDVAIATTSMIIYHHCYHSYCNHHSYCFQHTALIATNTAAFAAASCRCLLPCHSCHCHLLKLLLVGLLVLVLPPLPQQLLPLLLLLLLVLKFSQYSCHH